jgi:hypothetical protein
MKYKFPDIFIPIYRHAGSERAFMEMMQYDDILEFFLNNEYL